MSEIVKCPVCGRRMFDLTLQGETIVVIKCPHCKKVVSITRKYQIKKAHTEQRSRKLV